MELILTGDGSHTVYLPELKEFYHSKFGAIRETEFIFIEHGLLDAISRFEKIQILEIGFGTGLNAFMTQLEAEKLGKRVIYTALESDPLPPEIWTELNYPDQFCSLDYRSIFFKLHQTDWDYPEQLSTFFLLHKLHCRLQDFTPKPQAFNLIYFDAFAPQIQPELWTSDIFRKLFDASVENAVLVTYSANGKVRRAMKDAGFQVNRLSGPPGKTHITKAIR